VLHAVPDATEVDGGHGVEAVGRLVGQVARVADDAGIVERHIEPTERGDCALDHGGHLVFPCHVAGDADHLAMGRRQLVGRDAQRLLVDVGEHDGGASANARAAAKPMPELAPVTRAT
jgi:hypothetical protein